MVISLIYSLVINSVEFILCSMDISNAIFHNIGLKIIKLEVTL